MENYENKSNAMVNKSYGKILTLSKDCEIYPQLLNKTSKVFSCGMCMHDYGSFYADIDKKYFIFFCGNCINLIIHNDYIQTTYLTYPYLMYSDSYGYPQDITIIEKYEITKMCNDIRKSTDSLIHQRTLTNQRTSNKNYAR